MASLNTNTVALGTVIRPESWYKLQETLDHVLNLNQKKLQSKESQLVPGGAAASPQQRGVGNSARALPNGGTLNPTYFIDDVQKLCLLLEKVWT